MNGAALLIALLGVWPLTPAAAVEAAVAHHETLDAGVRNQFRYVTLPGATVEERRRNAMAVSYLLNSIGRSRLIVVPRPTSDDWQLLQIDLAAYANAEDATSYTELFEAWELLAKEDPYWHLRTEVADVDATPEQVTVDGGWIGIEHAKKLRELTGSYGAVLRADFFCAAVGERHYYRWSGIADTEDGMLKQLGIDANTVANLAAQPSANMLRSNVTRKPRRIIYRPGALGATFQTKDVDKETPATDAVRNPLTIGTQTFEYAATEWFVARANGLWGTAIFDAAGKRQDAVGDAIAKDHQDVAYGDGIVRPFWKCMRCHEAGGAGGLQPFVDDQSFLLSVAGIGAADAGTVQRITELYDPARLGKAMARAREDYEAAVVAATQGLGPTEAVEVLVELIVAYRDRPVTPEVAAAELGLTLEQLPTALVGTSDPILLALIHGRSVNRSAFESSYAEAAVLVAGKTKPLQGTAKSPGAEP